MNSGSVSCLLSLDISAAFDVLDHQALLKGAKDLFGNTGQVLLWFSYFLTGHQSFVSVGDYRSCTTSPPFPMKHGVPQGSTLGPIFFAMYVAPLEQIKVKFSYIYDNIASSRI